MQVGKKFWDLRDITRIQFMMRLGSWTTICCPYKRNGTCEEQDEIMDKAHDFLSKRFDKIGGNVRIIQNPHDFGFYPSFEIDIIDQELVDHENDDCDDCEDGSCKLCIAKDKFIDEANRIEEEYLKKFEDVL